jgi:hypothetical protein
MRVAGVQAIAEGNKSVNMAPCKLAIRAVPMRLLQSRATPKAVPQEEPGMCLVSEPASQKDAVARKMQASHGTSADRTPPAWSFAFWSEAAELCVGSFWSSRPAVRLRCWSHRYAP